MNPVYTLILLAVAMLTPVTGFSVEYPGNYSSHRFDGSTLVIETGSGDVQLRFVREDIVSVEYLDDAYIADSSLAVVPGHELPIPAALSVSDTGLALSAGELTVVVSQTPVRLSFLRDGHPLTFEPEAGGLGVDSTLNLAAWKVGPDEAFYGTGEHNISFDLSGQTIENNNEQHGWYRGRVKAMNLSVPVLLSSGQWGVFIDNPRFGTWEIKTDNLNRVSYSALDGNMKYYLFTGSEMPELVEAYTWLTGRQPLPARWTLGFLQSKYCYSSEDEVYGVVDSLRSYRIPVDGLILDLDWFKEMGDYEWDRERFPNPKRMVKKLRKEGIRTVLINEPYITQNSLTYSALYEENRIVGRTPEGEPFVLDDWWSCDCDALLLDLSHPRARKWNTGKVVNQLKYGIGGLWTDLCEPERHPETMLHFGGTQNDVHNSFNLYWASSVAEAFTEQRPNERIVNLTRSGSAGIQRYGVFTWSGDVYSNWDGLYAQPPFTLQMGLSGLAYHSSDLGGFAGPADADLYTRWLAQGALSPIMRAHGRSKPTEPFAFDSKHTEWNRELVELRYRLLPYIYSLAWENHRTGMPLVRPLLFEDPTDPRLRNEDTAYLFGDRLLVAPVLEADATGRRVPLPKGNWIEFKTDSVYAGSDDPFIDSPLGTIPLFAKGGSLLPMSPLRRNTGEANLDTLIVHSFPAETGQDDFVLYEDDGITLDYRNGRYSELPLTASWALGKHTISVGPRSGKFKGMLKKRTFLLDLHGVVSAPASVMLDGEVMSAASSLKNLRDSKRGWHYDARQKHLWIQFSSKMRSASTCVVEGYSVAIPESGQ